MDGIASSNTETTTTTTTTTTSSEIDDFKIRGAATRLHNDHGKQRQQQDDGTTEACTICLEAITERAVAVPCNHLTFDFLCLVSWLQERSACPLCNATITDVQYDFRGPEDYKIYRVPGRGIEEEKTTAESTVGRWQTTRRRRGQDYSIHRRNERRWAQEALFRENSALERRRSVYRSHTFSLHVGGNRISGYRDITPHDFTASTTLQSRARTFLRRELQVFSFLDTLRAREFLTEYILAILKMHELKGANGRAEDLVAEYLGRGNARLVLHELGCWLRSPFAKLGEWDACVQYVDPGGGGDGKRGGGGGG